MKILKLERIKIIDSTNMEYVNDTINKLKSNKIKRSSDINIIKEIESIPLYKKGKGLPIGNMTSQFLAIYYLNELDHFIKEELGIKYYIRYMDDRLILSTDKNYLFYCLNLKEIEKIIFKYKLNLNKKTRINYIKNGIEFLSKKEYNNYLSSYLELLSMGNCFYLAKKYKIF